MFGLKGLSILSSVLLIGLCKSDEPFFECTFKDTDCGIKNDPLMETQFIYGREHIGGQDQHMLYVNLTTATTHGARLITPYYHSNDKIYGCLRIQWFSVGPSEQSLAITQQDKRSVKIWSSYTRSYDWQNSAINLDLRGGDFRLFFEANFSPKVNGIIAIDDLKLEYNQC